jgi:hypothetical protein
MFQDDPPPGTGIETNTSAPHDEGCRSASSCSDRAFARAYCSMLPR